VLIDKQDVVEPRHEGKAAGVAKHSLKKKITVSANKKSAD
jgi:hypothetical protein